MCEKWWCELPFFIGNNLVMVLNVILLIVSIADNSSPKHFPRWSVIEWAWNAFCNSILIFLFIRTEPRSRHNPRFNEPILAPGLGESLSPSAKRNMWMSTQLEP